MIFLITQDTIIIKRFLNYYFYVEILIVFYAMLLHIRSTMHKKVLKFALDVEIAQLKFTYITVLK